MRSTEPKRGRGHCKTCEHPERARIELACANGVHSAKAARMYGASSQSVWRHMRDHVSTERKSSLRITGENDSKVDLEALKRNESESLLQNMIVERARLQRIADKAESVANYQDATRASTGVVKILELAAKYLGELKTGSTTVNNNFLLSPDWMQLRRVIALALRPYPEAQRSLLEAVRAFEQERGTEVTAARSIELKPVEKELVQ